MSPVVIGLVGGVASGKSTVADLFAALEAAVHLDADAFARRVLRRTDVVEALARRFPAHVDGSGRIDREGLASVVFSDRGALADLEEITHPHIRHALERALRRNRAPRVLLDAALLQESGAATLCDVVVYVACPAHVRRARARRDRGWSADEHRAREARQWSCRRKRAHADLVVRNDGRLDRTRRDVRRAHRWIQRHHESRGCHGR